jgi:hypothetical protein
VADCTAGIPEQVVYPALFYHATRLLLATGAHGEAIDLLLQERTWGNPAYRAASQGVLGWLMTTGRLAAARRLFDGAAWHADDRALRRPFVQRLARSLDEFLSLEGGPYEDTILSPVARAVLDALPTHRLLEVVDSARLTPPQRSIVARTGWTRAIVLDQSELVRQFAARLRQFDPAVAPQLDRVDRALTSRQYDDAVTLMIARMPRLGLHIDDHADDQPETIDVFNHNDRNWWCRYQPDAALWAVSAAFLAAPPPETGPGDPWIADRTAIMTQHPVYRMIDRDHLAALARVPNGPQWLSERTIAAVRARGWLVRLFDRVTLGPDAAPEMLHRAVRTTRYGCNRNGLHGVYSQAAFALIHARYPDSEWTRRTPYWFE